jgi:glycosyltransferase involved in cell wall biosynthesis
MPSIDILLATYNGEAYIDALVDSLLSQTYPAFRILVSDDGSTDATPQRLQAYAQRYPGRIVCIPNPKPGRGALRNFEHLMQSSLLQGQARWFAFADQDDVWLPDKLALSAQRMLVLEAAGWGQSPCLVHTDLCVVDEQQRVIHASMIGYEGLDPLAATRETLLSVNEVTGCTLLGNRSLLELALPIPDAAIVHDWWCAVLAGSGARAFLAQPTVYYRQHGANQIGARNRRLPARLHRLMTDAAGVWQRIHQLGRQTWFQAVALRHRLRERGLDDRYVVDYLRWRSAPRPVQALHYRRYYVGPELDRLSRWLLWRSFDTDVSFRQDL